MLRDVMGMTDLHGLFYTIHWILYREVGAIGAYYHSIISSEALFKTRRSFYSSYAERRITKARETILIIPVA